MSTPAPRHTQNTLSTPSERQNTPVFKRQAATAPAHACTQFAPHNLLKVRTMRWILVIILALIVLLAGYTVWPIFDLYRIASAVETRNSAALHALVDIPSFRASLTNLIIDAHRKQTDKSLALSERSERPAVGFGLAKILHPERLSDLLGKGSVSTDPALRSSLAAPFAPDSFGSAWQIWLNSDYSGGTFYVTVPVDRPSDQRFRIRLRLVHWDWKLFALDLPESTKTHLIQELAKVMADVPKAPN